MKVVVIPAKEFTIAKQRLADALPAPARAALARAMLEDVLAALAGAPVDRVVVITPDAEVAAVAERWGAAGRPGDRGPRSHRGGRARRRPLPGVGRDGLADRARGPPLPDRG